MFQQGLDEKDKTELMKILENTYFKKVKNLDSGYEVWGRYQNNKIKGYFIMKRNKLKSCIKHGKPVLRRVNVKECKTVEKLEELFYSL